MTVFNDTYDTVTPSGNDDPAEADDRIREVKAAVQERENVDHYWPLTGTEVSDEDAGEHRKITLRTLTADEVAALTATKAYIYRLVTDGELYFKDADDNTIQLTDKGNQLPNATYLKATNEADDGSVDLIKAGKNEADEADVAILSDAARMASNAAPAEDTGIANRKFVIDQIAATALSALSNEDADENAMIEGNSYKANSDGQLVVTWTANASARELYIYVGSADNPEGSALNKRAVMEGGAFDLDTGASVIIASGEYFTVKLQASSTGTPIIKWRSYGTLTKPSDQD